MGFRGCGFGDCAAASLRAAPFSATAFAGVVLVRSPRLHSGMFVVVVRGSERHTLDCGYVSAADFGVIGVNDAPDFAIT